MPRLALRLSPSTMLDGHVRERCPDMVFLVGDDGTGALRVDVANPALPMSDGCCDSMDAPLGFEVVIDEEAWLAECARLLAPGAPIRIVVPAEGPFAWLDSQNIYRYLVDILKRGDEPDLTRPTGWHRHYRTEDVLTLLKNAGFEKVRVHRAGIGLAELPMLLLLMWRNFLCRKRNAESNLFPLRERLTSLDVSIRVPGFGWHLVAEAVRASSTPEDPSVERENAPAREIGSE